MDPQTPQLSLTPPCLSWARSSRLPLPHPRLSRLRPRGRWPGRYNKKITIEELQDQCKAYRGRHLLVGARRGGEGTPLALCAAADFDTVFRRTAGSDTHEHKGVWWYCREGSSMGFAGTRTVNLNQADTEGSEASASASASAAPRALLSGER